jgi:hypothetical protein
MFGLRRTQKERDELEKILDEIDNDLKPIREIQNKKKIREMLQGN